jgi:hypothetical protein
MVNKLLLLCALGMSALLAGCQSLAKDHELPRQPVLVESRPLSVPHRDWIAQHCWPLRTQLSDGRWIYRKHCEFIMPQR